MHAKYRKIPIISLGLYICPEGFFGGLILGSKGLFLFCSLVGLLLLLSFFSGGGGGSYSWREFCASKMVQLTGLYLEGILRL